jgi:hypothetical protein
MLTKIKQAFSSSLSENPKGYRLPPRYGLIILGSGLLMFGGINRVLSVTTDAVKPQVVLVLLASSGGMLSLILAAAPVPAHAVLRRCYRLLMYPLCTASVFLILGMLITFAGTLNLVLQRSAAHAYVNDVISFTQVNTELVLAGRNPYISNMAFRTALEQYPEAPPTPMRRGVFGTGYDPPTITKVKAVEQLYLADPALIHGGLDPRTLHSYPALSFLFYVPLIWAGLPNILLLSLLICLGLLIWISWMAPKNWRFLALFTAGTAFCFVYSLPVDTEIVCIALLLAAWHLRQRKWIAPILLGLACAFKQYSWFFVPYFILEVWLTQGGRAVLRWCGVSLAAFLLPNLPYLIMSPVAWTQSLLLPISEPLFPQGIGIMALSLGHLLPYAPPMFYSICELLVLVTLPVLVLWLQRRRGVILGDALLIVALVPLLFAFRSPPNYFAFAPWLALYAANRIYIARSQVPVTPASSVAGRKVGVLA